MIKHPSNISVHDFDYQLPDNKIAKYPLEKRDKSKLLSWKNGVIEDRIFNNIPDLLPTNSLLFFNNTKVIRARLLFAKETGAKIEIFCLDPFQPSDYQLAFQQTKKCSWKCMIGNAKKWKTGALKRKLNINGDKIILIAEKLADKDQNVIQFSWDNEHYNFSQLIENAGILPIPPYLNRNTEASDIVRYQTVYSKTKGSVAAPTAGLHFTYDVLEDLQQKGHKKCELTLHVGAGTFKPVKSKTIGEHEMHSEKIYITKDLINSILNHKGPKIAVGTTSIRTLESIYWLGVSTLKDKLNSLGNLKVEQWAPYENELDISLQLSLNSLLALLEANNTHYISASTQIIIAPGYEFRVIDGMITNFHQPQSTLLLLISAFLGDHWKTIYNHALNNNYRFLSYGDSNLYLK